LKAFAFIKERTNRESYDMHRLVHIAMQNWLKIKDEWWAWNQKSLKQVSTVFPWPQHQNRAVWMIYLPHAQHIIATFNTQLSKTKETKELLGNLLHNLGWCSNIKGQYTEAEAIYRQTLQLKETVLGKDHPSTLMSMNNLAESLRQQGKYAEVEALY
jgi:tetratricopeptide (TPR) repeat protein